MSITSHNTIADAHTQADGSRYVRHIFVDSAGGTHEMPLRKVPGAWTETEYSAQRAGMIAELEESLAAAELEALLNGA